jgi:hypothetical protein
MGSYFPGFWDNSGSLIADVVGYHICGTDEPHGSTEPLFRSAQHRKFGTSLAVWVAGLRKDPNNVLPCQLADTLSWISTMWEGFHLPPNSWKQYSMRLLHHFGASPKIHFLLSRLSRRTARKTSSTSDAIYFRGAPLLTYSAMHSLNFSAELVAS